MDIVPGIITNININFNNVSQLMDIIMITLNISLCIAQLSSAQLSPLKIEWQDGSQRLENYQLQSTFYSFIPKIVVQHAVVAFLFWKDNGKRKH